jgi:hypothetical protein
MRYYALSDPQPGAIVSRAAIDDTSYRKGIKVPDAEFTTIRITPDEFHGDWKYAISPRPK